MFKPDLQGLRFKDEEIFDKLFYVVFFGCNGCVVAWMWVTDLDYLCLLNNLNM